MVLSKRTVNTSALVLRLPTELAGYNTIQTVRERHDRAYSRWPPHINLLYPFVPAGEFDIVVPMIQRVLQGQKPFSITLSRIDCFVGDGQVVFYAAPEGPVAELQIALQSVLPFCSKQSKHGDGFVPHLTLGRCEVGPHIELLKQLQASWEPMSWVVDCVDLLARPDSDNKEPFTCVGSLRFGEAAPPDVEAELSAARPALPKAEKGAHYNIVPTYAWREGKGWVASSSSWSDYQADTLRVVTYNVLFDMYEKDKIFSKERGPVLLDILKKCDADIVGLQEVTLPFLKILLKQEWVRSYYISEAGQSGTISPYGQLVLCRFPFKVVVAQFSKMKRIIVAEGKVNHRRFCIPVVHLTSSHQGHGTETLEKRAKQMQLVYRRTVPDGELDDGSDCLILGDFNLHDGDDGEQEIIRRDFVDSWRTCHPGLPGYTFDPHVNTLAKLNSNRGIRCRFDRALLRSGRWQPTAATLLGTEGWTHISGDGVQHELFASDHFGLLVTLSPHTADSERDTADPSPPASVGTAATNTLPDATQLGRGVLRNLVGPAADAEVKEQGIAFLHETVSNLLKGIDTPGSDIDVVVVASMDRGKFFKEFRKVVGRTPAIRLISVIEDALVPIIAIEIGGVPFDVQFCPLPAATDLMRVDTRPLDVKTVMTLTSVLDTEILLRSIPNVENFRVAMRTVKGWAKSRSLYSNQFGFFGGFGWAILLVAVCERYPRAIPEELVYRFFAEYSVFDWEHRMVTLQHNADAAFRRDREADKLVVLTLTKPYKNSARNATAGTRRVLIRELKRAAEMLQSASPPPWQDLIAPSSFHTEYKNYLCITMTASDLKEFRAWLGYLQSRLVMLLIKLEKVGVATHLAPAPYVHEDETWPFSRIFLAGVRVVDDKGSRDNFLGALHEFDAALDTWAGRTPGMYLEITQRRVDQLPRLTPAPNSVSAGIPEAEEEEEPPATIAPDPEPQQPPGPEPGKPKSTGRAKPKKGGRKEEEPKGKTKLRTSEDIYNRIKWDPSLDKSNCMIGYLDRFIGEQEMLFENWRKNPLDIIPYHRVVYFKINGDIVWDRRTRVDKLTEQ